MNLELNEKMTFEAMLAVLKEKLPYKITLKKNPIARFEYIVVRKSAFVGAWIRIMPKKNKVMLIRAVPSDIARGLLAGLILVAFTASAQGKVVKEVRDVLMQEFGTKAI